MKTYHHISFCLLFFCCFQFLSADNIKRERIYLQTDKQTYLAGELLWLKLYLTDETGRPSSFSKIGYVELLDESSARIQVKLDIDNGVGEGWMELPSTLSTGYYRLTGYTRYMRNEGEDVFFDKTIAIINTFVVDQTVKTDTTVSVQPASVLENNISVTTNKPVLSTRSQNELYIQGLPENIHSLCVSVTGKEMVPITGQANIFQWQKQLPSISQINLKSEFIPEYEGHIISGKLVDMVAEHAEITGIISPLLGFVGSQIRLFGGQVEKNKTDVLFYTRRIKGVHELATATYSLSSQQCRVDIQSPFVAPSDIKLPEFSLNPTWEDQLLQRSMGLQVLHTFIADSLNKMDTTYAHFQHKPSRTYLLDEYTRFTTMEEVVIEFIPTLRFRMINNTRSLSVLNEERNGFSIGNSMVLVDGIPVTDHESIFRYDPFLVKKIDVYRGKYNFGGQFFDGMIFFSTYNYTYPNLKVGETTQFFDYEGTQARRHFYAPAYINEEDKQSRIPDYRHTLLWLPEVSTNRSSSLAIPFSTSDLAGEFQITVEGLTEDGRIIRGTAYFDVK